MNLELQSPRQSDLESFQETLPTLSTQRSHRTQPSNPLHNKRSITSLSSEKPAPDPFRVFVRIRPLNRRERNRQDPHYRQEIVKNANNTVSHRL